MLKQRIITAVVLLAIPLPALFYPSATPFACVMLVMIGAAAWEWGRLNGYGPRMSVFLGIEMVVLCSRKPTMIDTPKKREVREKMYQEKYEKTQKAYLDELRKAAMIEYRNR